MKRSLLSAMLLLGTCAIHAQEAPRPVPRTAPVEDSYKAGWDAGRAVNMRRQWQERADRELDVESQLNHLRMELDLRRGSNNGQLKEEDRAVLKGIADRIQTDAPATFAAHMASYYAYFPQAEAFDALRAAARTAPDREELVAPWINATNRNGDRVGQERFIRQAVSQGLIAPGFLLAASDLLRSVDEKGILFTNGDMDTHAVLARQQLNDDRRDVLVIDQRLLLDPDYRSRQWRAAGAQGAVPADGVGFAAALAKATTRPVSLSMSLDPVWTSALVDRLSIAGIAFNVDRPMSMDALATRWWAMHRTPAAMPLSRNYLVVGITLWRHYNEVGDTANAKRTLKVLESLVKTTGGQAELQRLGIPVR